MQKLAILLLFACAACTTRADNPASQPASPSASQSASQPGSTSSTGGSASSAGATSGATSDLLAQIQAKIGKATCTSDSQCQVVPIGAKACGGPASYLAWSTAHTNGAELQALADRYRDEQQANNKRSNMISNCMVVAPPAVACRAGTCQAIDALAPR